MRKLFVDSLKMLYRDKQALFWALAFPVIFAVVFGLFDFGRAPEVPIRVVGDRTDPVYAAVVEGLKQVDSFQVTQGNDLTGAKRALDDGVIDVVVAIPPTGFTTGASLDVYYNETNFDSNQFAISAIEHIVDGMNLKLSGVEQPPITVDTQPVQAKSVDYYDFLLPGLVAMGVMNFSIIGMAVAIARFREQRILRRILATPLRPIRFLSAQVGARLLLSLVQSALILAVGVFVFGAQIYGNVLWLFVLTTIANLIFLNIGFAVAGRAANPDAAQGLGNAIALPMMFLSGVFFPTDTLPAIMQKVVQFLPLTPLIEALRKVAIDGDSITQTAPQLALLGAWMVVSFLVASRTFSFSEAR